MAMSITESGKYLSGLEELAQSVALYFRTPLGSVPLHPELGFAIFDYVDRNHGTILRMIREVRNGLGLWESRINVVKATATFNKDGKMKLKVTWAPVDDVESVQVYSVVV